MKNLQYGYTGQILLVDLSASTVKREPLSPELARKFIGSHGIQAKLAYDMIPAGADPLGPENVLFFGAGPFVGTLIPCSSRLAVAAKSPLTQSYGYTNTGSFVNMLKFSGYDLLIITGKASKPVYLRIFDDQVSIESADELWGKDTFETTDILWQKYPDSSVGSIGPAGEKLSMTANIMFNKFSNCGSSAIGAVMGSKNLKALVAYGTGSVRASDNRIMGQIREANKELMSQPHIYGWRGLGTLIQFTDVAPGAVEKMDDVGFDMAGWVKVYQEHIHAGSATCPSCPVGCKAKLELKSSGKKMSIACPAGTLTLPFVHFDKISFENYEDAYDITELCNRLGMSTMLASQLVRLTVSFLEEGILSPRDNRGKDLRLGDGEGIKQLIHDIAYREGLGDVLSLPPAEAIPKMGGNLEKYPLQKGVFFNINLDESLPIFKNRHWDGHTFGRAVDPRGPVAENAYCSIIWMPERSEGSLRKYTERIMIPEQARGKVLTGGTDGYNLGRFTRYIEDYNMVLFSMGLCQRSYLSRVMDLPRMAQLYSSLTGIESSPEELAEAGERILVMQRLFNVREGFRKQHDMGTSFASEQEERELSDLLDEYYEEHGWDSDGVPTPESLQAIGLGEYIQDVQNLSPKGLPT